MISKKVIFDYALVFILVIYAGGATTFTSMMGSWEDPAGVIFINVIVILYAYYYKIYLRKNFILFISGYLLYSIALTLKFTELHPRHISIYIINFFIAYVTISILSVRFFLLFKNVIYFLSIVSLFFWVVQLFLPVQLSDVLKMISFSEPRSDNVELNIIIFTINSTYSSEHPKLIIGGISMLRNPGFTWEPGAFAVFINLAIFLELIINRFKISIKFWILFVTLLTTFSTTGYGIFMLLMSFYVYNKSIRYKIMLFPLVILVGIIIMSLPFMSEKIIQVSDNNIEKMIENSILYDAKYTPQRFASFMIDFQDFKNNPLLGYGGHQKEKWTNKLGAEIATVSGIGKLLAKFGLIGTTFFFICLVQSSKELKKIFKFKGWGFFLLLILMTTISYSLIENPLLMCFWMFFLLYPRDRFWKNSWTKSSNYLTRIRN